MFEVNGFCFRHIDQVRGGEGKVAEGKYKLVKQGTEQEGKREVNLKPYFEVTLYQQTGGQRGKERGNQVRFSFIGATR